MEGELSCTQWDVANSSCKTHLNIALKNLTTLPFTIPIGSMYGLFTYIRGNMAA